MTTVVLGLDGAAFELLNEWINEGYLPNLQRLCAEGAAMDMQSCLPPVTCPNWRCYAAGVNPGKLGVFWWEDVDRPRHSISNTSSAEQFDGREYWSMLEGNVAVINFPTGFPPSSVDGAFIAGGPGSEQMGYTNPEKLEEELRNKFDYQVHPEKISSLDRGVHNNDCINEIYRLIDQRFHVLKDRLANDDYELIHMTVFYINVLQHFYWDDQVVRRAWQRIDDHIGSLLDSGEFDRLFVMSDHGSNRIETEFRINTWLEKNGYLTKQTGKSDVIHRLGITRERVRPLLNRFGLEWWARKFVPAKIRDLLPDSEGRIKKSAKEEVVDWKSSTAVASGQGPVYILAEDKSERVSIRKRLLDDLDGLRTPDGTLVVESAVPAESVWEGPYVADGPDLVLKQAPNVHIDGSIGAEEPFAGPDRWRGENKDTGLFVAYGKEINPDTILNDMHITDIAPTILHLHGVSVPKEMDGTPRTALFESESDAASRTVLHTDANWINAGEFDRDYSGDHIQDRLIDLGYLSE